MSVIKLVQPDANRPLVDGDGVMSDQARVWFSVITDRALIVGDGAPEGVVEGIVGAEYMNTSGISGTIKYIKRDADIGGDKTKGWVLI